MGRAPPTLTPAASRASCRSWSARRESSAAGRARTGWRRRSGRSAAALKGPPALFDETLPRSHAPTHPRAPRQRPGRLAMASIHRPAYARDAGPWPSNTRQLDLAHLFPAMADTLRSGGGGGYALEPFVHERRYYWFHGAAPPHGSPPACTCSRTPSPRSLSRIPPPATRPPCVFGARRSLAGGVAARVRPRLPARPLLVAPRAGCALLGHGCARPGDDTAHR